MNYSKYNFKKVFKLVHKASYMLSHTGSLRTHTTKWLSYTLLYKMASKTSKISRL
jgi:hypothetical protein